MKLFSLAISLVLVISACSRNMNSGTYTSSSAGGVVLEGTIVSARAVTIKETDKLQNNTLGGLAGGAVGGVAGHSVGNGSGQAIATGMEYIVKLAPGNTPPEKTVTVHHVRDTSVEDKVKNEIKTQGTSSTLLSVAQGKDVIYTPGQHVYIVYSDDRPRITAASN